MSEQTPEVPRVDLKDTKIKELEDRCLRMEVAIHALLGEIDTTQQISGGSIKSLRESVAATPADNLKFSLKVERLKQIGQIGQGLSEMYLQHHQQMSQIFRELRLHLKNLEEPEIVST